MRYPFSLDIVSASMCIKWIFVKVDVMFTATVTFPLSSCHPGVLLQTSPMQVYKSQLVLDPWYWKSK